MNKIKTYIVNGLNPSINIGATGITGYKGVLYYLSSPGGQNGSVYSGITNSTILNHGGCAGYVISGYCDFDSPYPVSNLSLTTNTTDTSLSLNLIGDPTNGTNPIVINVNNTNTVYQNTDNFLNYTILNRVKDINSTSEEYFQTSYFKGSLYYQTNDPTPPLNVYKTYDQRNNLYLGPIGSSGSTGYDSSGNICPLYGNIYNNVLGGAGFYGNNGDTGDSYGYSSGYYTVPNYGYGIISLIPNDFILTKYFITGDTGITGNGDIILYSLNGGGGGGGGWSDDGNGNARGGGGGGSGDFIHGFLQVSNTLNIKVGLGGTGGGQNSNGQTGGNTNLNNITAFGGSAGGFVSYFNNIINNPPPNTSGSGGPGYYGGGGGVGGYDDEKTFTYSHSGASYTNIYSYNGQQGVGVAGISNSGIAGIGRGSVSYSGTYIFGDAPFNDIKHDEESGGGGGGGFWGGNGTLNGGLYNSVSKNASGYGCGGGGGSQEIGTGDISGGSGSPGYAIINFINKTHPYLKVYKITTNTTFNSSMLDVVKGFWFFLSGNGPSTPFGGGKSYHNTGHFLINEDGVSQINITKPNGYFNIQVIFKTTINETPQFFNLTANSPQPYMMILFYT